MPYIKTSKGKIKYKVIPLFWGVKRINKKLSRENLEIVDDLSKKHKFRFMLGWGTLLGAVRDSDFIDHDEDTDLLCLESEEDALLDMIPDLLEKGFKIARYEPHRLLSVVRKDEYMDFYIHRQYNEKLYICGGNPIPKQFLDEVSQIKFLQRIYLCPKDIDGVLEFWYGEDWRTPVIYNNYNLSKVIVLKMRVKSWLKYHLPNCILVRIQEHEDRKFMKREFLDKGKLDGFL